ncbi:hypothetical protein [Nocardia sp. NPDC049707]|uniref:hypothetical protein n=1 Tax=Nocardia sp. NPDC049707 TaxID=3154735 RepID=UPI00341A9980
MSIHSAAASSSDCHPALWSVRLIFLFSGLLFATWAARIPTVKNGIGLDEAGLAVVFAGLNIGAIAGLQLGKFVTLRFGSRSTLRVAVPAFAVCPLGPTVRSRMNLELPTRRRKSALTEKVRHDRHCVSE